MKLISKNEHLYILHKCIGFSCCKYRADKVTELKYFFWNTTFLLIRADWFVYGQRRKCLLMAPLYK